MSFLKMVMKSRKRSTQCLKEQENTLESTAAGHMTNERVDRFEVSFSPHVVFVSMLSFLNDELGVKQDEAAHDEQPEVHVSLRRRSDCDQQRGLNQED